MGRFEQRRERNKKLIADVDNFLFDNQKIWDKDITNGMPDDEDHKDGFIKSTASRFNAMLFNRGWCWLDLSSLLSLIRSKMIDLGKTNEFEILVKEFHDGDIINLTYSNWNLRSVIDFTTRLIVDFPEAIQAIAKDQEKEVK